MIRVLVFCLTTLSAGLLAQGPAAPLISPYSDEVLIRNNPSYSAAILVHSTPESRFSQLEKESAEAQSEFKMFLRLPLLAKAALEAGFSDKASEYASRALQLAEKFRRPDTVLSTGYPVSNVGDAVFTANLVLGRLALAHGDIEASKHYLLSAGQSGGSPNLDTFGPGMSLAREILVHTSDRETVLKFIEECKLFWKLENGRLGQWAIEIQGGKIPDFGFNLFLPVP